MADFKQRIMRYMGSVKNITLKKIFKYLTIFTVFFIWTEKVYFFSNKDTKVAYIPDKVSDTSIPNVVQKQESLKNPSKTNRKKNHGGQRLKLFYSQIINGVKASKENMYITHANYQHRNQPQYFNDNTASLYQLTTYYAAGELARRYQARYIIDLGCGAASKLAAFHGEFHLIGIDFKTNLEIVRQNYPYIDLIELDLDQDQACKVSLPPGILSQAVVISGDVIEHLVDPFSCYMRLIQELAHRTMAMVISTPDRQKLSAMHRPESINGPPYNPSHVREWLVEEMEIMFLDHGIFPVALGWECFEGGKCGHGFTPETSSHTTSVLMIANTQVRSMWIEIPHDPPGVYAYLTVQSDVNQQLLDYNLLYLKDQGISVCLVAVGSWEDTQNTGLPMVRASSMEEVPKVIANSVNDGTFKEKDWIMVLSAHEIVSFPHYSVWNLTLHDSLIRIGHEPYGFNAVAMSIFFMQDSNGLPHTGVPFKIFGPHPWTKGDATSLSFMRSPKDTLQQRVRIWKRGPTSFKVSLTLGETAQNTFVVGDVDFLGRKVYPFHAQSLRFHPSFSAPYSSLSQDFLKMYVLETTVGYYEESRGAVMTNKYLY